MWSIQAFPSQLAFCRPLRGLGRVLLAVPRPGCAVAWGYHSARRLRRLVECFLSGSRFGYGWEQLFLWRMYSRVCYHKGAENTEAHRATPTVLTGNQRTDKTIVK